MRRSKGNPFPAAMPRVTELGELPAGGDRVAQPGADLAAVAGGLRPGNTIWMVHRD